MATIIGGAGTGLWDSSLYLLNRRNVTGAGEPGHDEQIYINISNGDLVLRHQDAYLPSEGEDFSLIRTYNSRGQFNTDVGKGWTLSVFLDLDQITNNKIVLVNPDSSRYTFNFDATAGVYRSVDGPGAYETIVFDRPSHTYTLTRSDQTKLTFDGDGTLLRSEDPNGNRMVFHYDHGDLTSIEDDTGHVIRYHYDNGNLTSVTDETGAVLVRYQYDGGNRLQEMTDRAGHETHYDYYTDGTLASITLPHDRDTASRTLQFEYTTQSEGSDNERLVLSALIDAEGNRTEFDYNFNLVQNKYQGGTTRMLNALGVNRMRSNDPEYVAWRLANGYYQFWSEHRFDTDPVFRAQANAIRDAYTTVYTFDQHGEVTSVTEPRGFTAAYQYDALENLTAIVDANADAITRSDDAYFRNLRRDFGYVNALTGQGKLVAELTAADVAALKERYTTHLEYDASGNLIKRTDNADNVTSYTYTSFNKLASQTAAMGNALVTSDDAFYQDKRKELGYINAATGAGKRVAELSAAEKQALLALYTTTYGYDAKQNLIEIKNPGGDLTRFAYDSFGNLIKKTVYLDQTDLVTPTKQQITQYFYDAFGNNIETIDAEGNTTFASFDHFGNRTSFTDGRGGITRYTYDNDNRLITVTDPEGNVTVNTYDAVGNRIAMRDANGHTVVYVYDRNNMLITVTDPSDDGNNTKDRVTRYQYDVVDNRTAATDAEGRTATYLYREDNRLLTVTTPPVAGADGVLTQYTTSYAYDGVGNRISVRDQNGNLTQYVYNQDNLLKQTTDALGQVTQYSYDADLNRVSIVVGAQLIAGKRQVLRFGYDEEDQLIAQTDALGNTTVIAYDAPGNRIGVTDSLGRTTNFSYDRNNRLLKETRPTIIDPNTGLPVRYTVSHQYDANGNQIATTDENGHVTKFTFDNDNRMVMMEDGNGIKTVYTYDSRNNRTSIQIGVQAHVDAAGKVVIDAADNAQVTTHIFDEFNQLVATTDGVGNALTVSDSPLYRAMRKDLGFIDPATGLGKLAAQLTAADKQALKDLFTERYTYDKVGNYTRTTDHLGRSTAFTYDALNRQVTRTDALGNVTRFAYDGNGNRVKETDALGRLTTFAYDADNRLIDTTDALGVRSHRDYDSFGNLTADTRAAGTPEARTTQYVYDLDNRLIQQTDPEGHTQTFEYDAVGNRLKITDGRGQATRYVYDALNRNIKIIDPLTFETRFEYDGVGNRITLIDAKGGVQRLTYDGANRYIQTQDAEGRITRFSYDVRGNRITQTTGADTPEQETTTFEYDAENHLTAVVDAQGNRTSHAYDRVYNRIQTTDGNGHSTLYAFDALNRTLQITDAEGGVTRFTYDAASNRLSQTDALSRVTSYVYDARNQLVSQFAPDGVETRYAYDRVGNRVSIVRAANTPLAAATTFVYNRDDQLIAQTDALGHTTTYQYDANHNRTVTTDPLGFSTTYIYDADNRISRIVDPLGNTTTYVYDGNGNRVQVIDARGFVSTTYYNADNEVALAVDNEGYATGFTYDHNGNVVAQTLYARPLTLPLDPAIRPMPAADSADRTTRFNYDKVNRLIQRTDGEGFITQFAYDSAGNRIETRQALDLAATRFAVRRSYYDGINREVMSLSAEGYLSENRYDAVGNRVARIQYDQKVAASVDGSRPRPASGDAGRITAFVYDANNRLLRQTSALGVNTDYAYDARGNRVSMTEAAGSADTRTTLYRYDAADRYIETINALGVSTRLELDADGNVLTRREAFGTLQERVFTFVYDGNNRVVRETNAIGVVTSTAYDAAGNVVSRTTAAGLPEARTETFTYDRNNRQTAAVNAAGERTEFAYDAAGNRIRLTQAPGLAEERSNFFAYDRDNRLVATTDAMGTVTQYRYDGAGNKIQTTQAVGLPEARQTFYVYDQDNRLMQVTDPVGGVTRYDYDALGNQTRIVDANGGVQQNTFDIVGRVVSSLSAGGVLTRHTYDLRDNIVATTQSFADGSDARTTTYAYDLLNRQTRVTDGEGFSTSMTYDAFGNQLAITHGQYLISAGDPAYDAAKAARAFPQTNTFVYDAANHMLSMTDGESNITSYTYDAVGNRASMTEAANTAPRTTTYVYDLVNRVIETRTPEGGVTRESYDKVGNKIAEDQLQSGDLTTGIWIHTRFEYDKNGRLRAQIDAYGIRTEYTYDAMGNTLSRRSAAGTPDERVVRMEYDFNNRKTADIDGEGNRTTYAYDGMGNRIKLTDAMGRVAHYYFDGANQLTAVVDPAGFINTFTFDAAGNRIQERVYMTRVVGPIDDRIAPAPAGTAQDRIAVMQYDRAGRLIARTESDGKRTEITYDGAGNKIVENTFANTSAPRAMLYAYDLDNRLIKFTDVEGTVTSFTYDGANNKLSETIANPSDANAVRATFYRYDLNNRRISETFDPNGLNIVLLTAYDKVANIVAKTDGNGHTTTFTYDLNNRQLTQADALGNTTRFAYDAAGNRIAVTDALGNTTRFTYDGNNRQIQAIQPQVEVFTIAGGLTTLQPTVTKQYDAVGNEVQTVDANGFVTTRYFDGDNRLVAELNGDNVLREYAYNAAGDQVMETLYMTRLTAADHNPDLRPTPPPGEARTITREYDLAGRLTRTIYPPALITTLINTDTGNPMPVSVLKQVEERRVYDAFGQEVESFDREGNRAVTYYDTKGRKTAVVDALGYLVEWDYDAQDNQISQRVYAQRLDPASISPAVRPTPPEGEVFVTSRRYDAASRLIEEKEPQIEVFDPVTQAASFTRPTTTYTYDRAGNQLTKTLGAGSPQAVTEYNYYDAGNRRIAVINSGRVLHSYQYDANGNLTAEKRFINTVSAGVDLSALNGGSDFAALVSADPNNDQATSFIHDALNRLTQETDLMGPSSADDISKRYHYDAVDNRTFLQDEDGFITQTSYDAANRVLETINPDGDGTLFEYDAAGNQIFVFTGKVANAAVPASNISARLSDAVTLTWNVAGSNQQTWVVYDTASHIALGDYANRTQTQISFTGSAQAELTPAITGSTLFFRVVTRDGAGNITWTAEQSLSVPPRFSSVAVAQPDPHTLTVSARFDDGTVNPALAYGTPGNLTQSTPFLLQADGSYLATLSGVTDPDQLDFKLTWQDAASGSYSSAEGQFKASADQVGISSQVSQDTVTNGVTTSYKIHVATKVPSTYAAGLTVLQAQWRIAGSGAAFAATAISGVDSGLGFTTFDFTLGDATPLNAGDYEILLSGVRQDGSTVLLDSFNFTVGAAATTSTQQSLSWIAPPAGDDQIVIIGGERADSTRQAGRVLVDGADVDTGTIDYLVFYGQRRTQTHTLDVTSKAVTKTIPDPKDPKAPPQIIITGYDLGIAAALSADETAAIDGDLHLAWRPAGTGGDFANDIVVPPSSDAPNTFAVTLANLAAGQYDLKLYYTDAQGREVIMDWRRADTAAAHSTFTGASQTVLARETGGTITRSAAGVLSLDPGLYTGALDAAPLLTALALNLTPTNNPGGSQDGDGRTTGYFTKTLYNALNFKVATNENDGLWREFGVDGNGRTLATRLFGEEGAPSFIATYTTVDARGRKTAEYGPPVAGTSGLIRPVHRYSYNVFDKMTVDIDALGRTRQSEYNALGSLVKEIDPNGNIKLTRVDQFGRETATVSELGHVSLKFYDLQGRLIKERDALGNETGYSYDAFDRKITQTDGLGMATADPDDHTLRFAYDQRDRLIREEQPQGWHLAHDNAAFYQDERTRLGFAGDAAALSEADRQALIARYSTSYAYDGRNNRISTFSPLGQRTDQVYDSVGRVIDTEVYLNGEPTHNQRAYDAYGNLIAETDGEGRTKTHLYGGFGRLLQDFDEDGNQVAYTYDIFGRTTREFDPNGAKDVRKTYDDAGRLLSIQDLATGVSTTYTYDLLGRRLSEIITTPGDAHDRNISYTYDALGQLVRWADAVTGLSLNLLFDAEGNRVRAYTDAGYDPLSQNTDANPNYRYIDHVYTFDGARRVTQEVQRTTDASGHTSDALVSAFGYDAASNRIAWNNQGTIVDYTYDANGRAVQGDFFASGSANQQVWTYDAMGNVLSFRTLKDGNQTSSTITQYNDANRSTVINKDNQITTQSYDRSLRITQTILRQNGKTFYYNHSYFGDGREKSISAFGDAFGNSTSTYDANKIRIGVNLGQGDGQSRPETKNFVSDNEGHILFQFHDDGKSGTPETREYIYANGNPVGESGHGLNGVQQVLLDTGTYNPIQNLGDSFPGGVLSYTARDGDTLQGIASQMYGNASLWFVLADANGLNPNEPLKAGTTIQVPNSVKSGHITADNHKVYSESEIVGSTLPNLKTPPPPKPKHGCGSIIMIIIIVVIAIVVSVITAGIAAPLAAGAVAAVGATAGSVAAFVVTAAVYAVVGAVVAAIGSIVQQGLFIAMGYQEKFSWKAVGNAAVAGALSGAAQGVGAAAQAAAKAGELSAAGAQYAKIAVAALKTASAASTQLLEHGKITSWTSLAAAAVGGYASAGQQIAAGEAANAAGKFDLGAAKTAYEAGQAASRIASIANYVSPWAQLAETYVRHDHKLTPLDWATAVGSTLSQAVSVEGEGKDFENAARHLGASLFVAGALRHYDKDAAQSYFENSVGQEVGQYIGNSLGKKLDGTVFKDDSEELGRVYNPTLNAFINKDTGQIIPLPTSTEGEATNTRVFQKDATGQYADQYGNPSPRLYASLDTGTMTDVPVTDEAAPSSEPPLVQTRKVTPGDSFWNIAKQQLGPGATNADIQKQVYALMEMNQGADPRALQVGQEINLVAPGSGIEVSNATLSAYQRSDTEYQNYRAEQVRIAAEANVPSPMLTPGSPGFDTGSPGIFGNQNFGGGPLGAEPHDNSDAIDLTRAGIDATLYGLTAYNAQRVASTLQFTNRTSMFALSTADESLLALKQTSYLENLGTSVENVVTKSGPFGTPDIEIPESSVARTQTVTARAGTVTAGEAEVLAAEVEDVTTVAQSSARNAALAKAGKVLSNPLFGGAIEAGVHLYEDYGKKDALTLSVGATYDAIFGTANSAVATGAGVVAGTLTTAGVALTPAAPAAPVAGIAVGVGTTGLVSYGLGKVYNNYVREPLIEGTVTGIGYAQQGYQSLKQWYNNF